MVRELEVRPLQAQHDMRTDTREQLAHADQYAQAKQLKDYFIADIDSHHYVGSSWPEVVQYFEDPVMKRNAEVQFGLRGGNAYLYGGNGASGGTFHQDVHGRIVHQSKWGMEPVDDQTVHKDVTLIRRSMDAMGIDVQIVFPTEMLGLAMTPVEEEEVQSAYAYNRWFVDKISGDDDRIKFLPYLPLRNVEMSLRIIDEFAGKPGVVGFLITSHRHDPVHHNRFMPIYAALQEAGYPIAFHAGPTWDDEWMRGVNKWISMHALSFVHCTLVHCTNWIMNGMPERFPSLNVIWVESGLAWIPYLMQRLDSEFLKRTSDAPLLKRLPSEYMQEMFYTSQPMESDHPELLESTFRAMHAESQLLYASDWPHWDFDLPQSILEIPFIDEQAKRNILGENARKLFNL